MAGRIADAEDAARQVRADPHEYVKVGIVDMDGLLRGKFMHRDKFVHALHDGFGFCDVVLGWDMQDGLYDRPGGFTGWHTGFPDAPVRIVPQTGRQIPFEEDIWLFLGEFAGAAEALCPRGVLRRVLARADAMGYRVQAGFEYEFFLFAETPQSVHDKDFAGLIPAMPGNTGYSMLRMSGMHEFYRDLLDTCTAMEIPLEGLHEEMGPGVVEAAISVTDGLEAADRAALFKSIVKMVAQRHGLMATFMAKWSAQQAGQSGHIHVSLGGSGQDGNIFHSPGAELGMSEAMRRFVAGQQATLPEFTALCAPTANSYRRLVPGIWAPTDTSWGIDNRTCALRVIPGSAKSQRVEHRLPGADANPYLALAATIASGLYGIENELAPGAPVSGDASGSGNTPLPGTLADATRAFSGSAAARDWFGDAFVDHFAASRDWEARQYAEHVAAPGEDVSTWELARYFELI